LRHLPRAAAGLRLDGLRGVFTYVDAQMTDDAALGLWAARRARDAGVQIHEHAPVDRVGVDGEVAIDGTVRRFDAVANVAGPWARALLDASGIPTRTRLDLVRGSHIVVDRPLTSGFALQLPLDGRLVFALPYQGRTLVGTTEVRQPLDAPIRCSNAERDYLLGAYNAFFRDPITAQDVRSTFAGLRPLVHRGRSAHAQRRGERIERTGRVVTVFGGKWTGSRALAERVARSVERT
jgi:glycerol-3-phosphate dehydrogenase